MSSRWGGERPRSNLNRKDELRQLLEDEWRTRRRLYPQRPDSDVTPLGPGTGSPIGGSPSSPPAGDSAAAPFEDQS